MDNEFENKEVNGQTTAAEEGSTQTAPIYHAPEVKRNHKAIKITAVALACAVLGGAAGSGVTAAILAQNKSNSSTTIYQSGTVHSAVNTAVVDSSTQLSDSEIYSANVNSTVGITTQVTTNYFGYSTTGAASGSGFILSEDGYIVTNYHVVEDSTSITVTCYDGSSYDAVLVGYDESNDVAVLKINASGLTPVVLGSSANMSVGDHVVAIGNPLGELTFSLTQGSISAVNRNITVSSGVTMNLIQTDCAINSGNSGGALFNSYGEVIGITNAKYSSSSSGTSVDNIGFAIPIDNIIGIVNQIIENGYIAKPYIGVSILTVSDSVKAYGIPAGASIQSVTENSPAEEAGLQVNDVITAINGTEVTSSSEVTAIVSAATPGDILELTIYRNGENLTINVTVGEKQQSALPEADSEESADTQSGSMQSGSDPYSYYGQYMPGYSYGSRG